ncbi:hypothetical protein PISL3812_06687 [Talaromyces islandicus]|uniref:Mid2 domain-containing protein n=1 Tax=Talaromyces islandicus TaxID=28573 RepID=A0A0U1M246_TALIS|nr:hypothetical protein PISL3812_06687 [Talaromyces islandicus]
MHSLSLSLRLLVAAPLAAAVCYYPNGYSEPSTEYEPCNQYSGARSMCCGVNRSNPSGGSRENGSTADTCLRNGLCENRWQDTYDNGTTFVNTAYFRDQCTSTNWEDDCLNICTEQMDPQNGSSSLDVVVTPCDGTSSSETWCCGATTDCCDTSPITIAQIFNPGTTSTTSASTATATSTQQHTHTSTATSTPSPSESSPSSSSSGLSTGAKAGVGVGVAVGVIALFAVGFIFLRRRKSASSDYVQAWSPQQLSEYQQPQQQQAYSTPEPAYVQEKSAGHGDQRYEKPADGENQRYEMPS